MGTATDNSDDGSGAASSPLIQFRSIGVIRTPFPDVDRMPIQPGSAEEARGYIDLDPGLADGLLDIGEFSHLILVWHLHRASGARLVVVPFLDDRPHGVFATRAPTRPNPIGLSVVRLVKVEGTRLHIQQVDMVDGTPLLDIKPYVPAFDDRSPAQIGWYRDRLDRVEEERSDQRFTLP